MGTGELAAKACAPEHDSSGRPAFTPKKVLSFVEPAGQVVHVERRLRRRVRRQERHERLEHARLEVGRPILEGHDHRVPLAQCEHREGHLLH